MGFYRDHVVPLLIDLSMRQRNLADYRRRVIPAATGRVLEIGIGSGFNLPLYGANVKQVIGLDPSPKLLAMARKKLGEWKNEDTAAMKGGTLLARIIKVSRGPSP